MDVPLGEAIYSYKSKQVCSLNPYCNGCTSRCAMSKMSTILSNFKS